MPRKLGQHFLKNKSKIREIIDCLNLKTSDKVIEIGPGKGALTKELGERHKKLDVTAVERDEKLIGYLKDKVVPDIKKNGNKINILYGNILSVLPGLSEKMDGFNECKIVGNIPYYITGKLLRVFEEIEPKPSVIVLTVQKEVAERITAGPPKMNILSASVNFWGETQKISDIRRGDFSPSPEVDSSIIKIIPKKHGGQLKDGYYKTIKILFKHPRKTLKNNISIGLDIDAGRIDKVINKAGIEKGARPQNLSIENIKELSTLLYNKQKSE